LKQTSLQVIILAAGKGSRMDSELPKVIHKINNKTLLNYVIDTAIQLIPKTIMVVVGYMSKEVTETVEDTSIKFIKQQQQLGTGHAVAQCIEHIDKKSDTLILYGDVPLISYKSLSILINNHRGNNNDASILSSDTLSPTGYGRIIRDKTGSFIKIKEEKDATNQEKMIKEINTGICIFKGSSLEHYINKIDTNNKQNEFYLTDIFSILLNSGRKIGTTKLNNHMEAMGINTKQELAEASSKVPQ